jgi:hypothetical protein
LDCTATSSANAACKLSAYRTSVTLEPSFPP